MASGREPTRCHLKSASVITCLCIFDTWHIYLDGRYEPILLPHQSRTLAADADMRKIGYGSVIDIVWECHKDASILVSYSIIKDKPLSWFDELFGDPSKEKTA